MPPVVVALALASIVGAVWIGRRRASGGRVLTRDQLLAVVPRLASVPSAEVEAIRAVLSSALDQAGAVTPRARAAFLAQLAHESGGFRYLTELASGAAYEGRRDLGNTEPGDGTRYKGRGWIQLTGRANYRAAGTALGLALEAHPGLAAEPQVAGRVAAWYWRSRGLGPLADAGDFEAVTRRINGGLNGLADRLAYYQRALAAGV